jgi:uncharacterized protein YqgC (DUF456 family)
MGIGETGLTIIASILMIGGLLLSVLPFLPGPFLLWLISLIYAILTEFRFVTPLAMVIITVFMLAGSTKDFWMPILGMKTYGVSCSTALGMMIGGTAGTFLIPVPVLGTLLGAIGGAVLLELLSVGEMRRAFQAGGIALKAFILGMLTELGFNLLIVAVFFGSLLIQR